jgi:hypothetical protein
MLWVYQPFAYRASVSVIAVMSWHDLHSLDAVRGGRGLFAPQAYA